jgi:hypothetical protein
MLAPIEKLITTIHGGTLWTLFRKNILGQYLTEFPDCTAATISKFSIMIMWLNRSAILFQLAYKDKTNFDLLKVSRQT